MKAEFQPFKFVWSDLIAIVVFVIAFWAIPIRQLDGFQFIPGDIGDSRLNNYFLEHIYQFVIGKADSLWHLPFFAPFPYVGGFSDNHFGTSIFYVLFRYLGARPFDAFQLWFLLGYFLNFFVTYYVMRRLGGSPLAAAFGALVFAFALPTTAHANHVQLHYRFLLPLVVFFTVRFCLLKDARQLLIAFLWLLWQLFCGIYMGFFTFLLMVGLFVSSLFIKSMSTDQTLTGTLAFQYNSLRNFVTSRRLLSLTIFSFFLFATAVLFYPYLMVKTLYGFGRGWPEISLMMPRLQSYIISDVSTIWGGLSGPLFDLPIRHEHQMFPGLLALLLGLMGGLVVLKSRVSQVGLIIAGATLLIVMVTLSIFGFTIWYLFHWLPVVSAIRAVVRVDQALLFPLSYFVMLSVDHLSKVGRSSGKLLIVFLFCLMIYEFSAVKMPKSSKVSWEDRINRLDERIPQQAGQNRYLLVAREPEETWYAHELDVMWVAQRRGIKTMNGYSGNVPPGFSFDYPKSCEEVRRRLNAISGFYQAIQLKSPVIDVSDISLIGFDRCIE